MCRKKEMISYGNKSSIMVDACHCYSFVIGHKLLTALDMWQNTCYATHRLCQVTVQLLTCGRVYFDMWHNTCYRTYWFWCLTAQLWHVTHDRTFINKSQKTWWHVAECMLTFDSSHLNNENAHHKPPATCCLRHILQLSSWVNLMRTHGFDTAVVNQFFKQLFYFIVAHGTNNLLLRKDMCNWSKGMQVRWGLLYAWIWSLILIFIIYRNKSTTCNYF